MSPKDLTESFQIPIQSSKPGGGVIATISGDAGVVPSAFITVSRCHSTATIST